MLSSVAHAVSLTQPPQQAVTPGQVTLWWQTDVSATSEVYWGPTSQPSHTLYPSSVVFSGLAGTVHSRTLINLAPGTWFYRVRSQVTAADSVVSAEGTFTVTSRGPLGNLAFDGPISSIVRKGSQLYLAG